MKSFPYPKQHKFNIRLNTRKQQSPKTTLQKRLCRRFLARILKRLTSRHTRIDFTTAHWLSFTGHRPTVCIPCHGRLLSIPKG